MSKKTVAICFAQVPFVRGGAELHVEALDAELKKRGFASEIVCVPYKWYPREELLKHAFLWRLVDLSEANGTKIDLVIATKFPSYYVKHTNKVTWLIHQFRQVYDLWGTPYSEFNEQSELDRTIKNRICEMDRLTLNESRRIFTNSKNTAYRLQKFNQVTGEPLYHPPGLVGRYRFSSIGDYILSVGRLDRLKRIDLLIESLKFTSQPIRCIIAGTGPEERALKKLVSQNGLESRVTFAGFVSDETLLELYADCFAVYYAPFDEDYGYVTLEALLSKKPVVTTVDAGGVLEFIENGETGVVCQTAAAEIGHGVETLFSNKKLAAQYGQTGYGLVKDITWDYVIRRLTETL